MDDSIDCHPNVATESELGQQQSVLGIVDDPSYKRTLEDLGRIIGRSARNHRGGVTWKHLTVQPVDEFD
jgi:hypothetical protein